MRFAAGKQVLSAESRTRNGRQVYHMRFAAGQRQGQRQRQGQGQERRTERETRRGTAGKRRAESTKKAGITAGLHILYLVTY